MSIGRADGRFGNDAVECVTLVVSGYGDAFQIAQLGVQVIQLSVWTEFEFKFLAALQLSELLGLLVAGQDFMDRGWG